MGSGTGYSLDLCEAICKRLAAGESLRSVCRTDGYPAASTVCDWLREYPTFAEHYARARNVGLDLLADQVLEIADGSTDANAQSARLQVDARKWYLSKLAAKKYGERIAHEVAGPNEGPVRLEHGIDPDPDRLAALATLLGELMGSAS